MVATILKLRFRILGNTLTRSPWRIVGLVFGIFGGLWLLFLAAAGMVGLLVFADADATRSAVVIGGAALTLGWVIGPLVSAGMDSTVDADHLAPLPLSRTQVMQVLMGTGLTGVPGIITTLAALTTVIAWSRSPISAIIAVPCAFIGVVMCVLASRLLGAVSASSGGRRWQELLGTIALFLLILTGPIMTAVTAVLSDMTDLAGRFAQLTRVLEWTPIGAIWAVPGDALAGNWLLALARLAIALVTIAALWLLWGYTLDRRVSTPAKKSTHTAKAGELGLFGKLPTGPFGATLARSLTFWLRDPRYMRQLIVLPLFPILMLFTSGVQSIPFALSGVFAAFMMCTATYTDVSYDGTAFASVLATGMRGRADRAGRLLASAIVITPLILLLAIIPPIVAGYTEYLAAAVGTAVGVLFVGFGVAAVSSALMVMPVAAPGDNPFKTVPGQTFLNGLAVFAVIGVTGLLSLPIVGLCIASIVMSSAVLGWVTLAVGVIWGLVVAALGIVFGGNAFDRNAPRLLASIRAFPTA
ncbi:hypothetical protein ICL81_04110 [Leucobacter sp. cx-328]|uniref:hypothetical protein n=1 Tax=unclassified Leucobacter TaxID=2621730 RepID=UPI00165E5FCF|nr:hypothetical protein [Leucobacter sp. cx-328]